MSADGDDTTPSPYLTAREAAAYLHLNEKTLYAMIQDSGIPATKVKEYFRQIATLRRLAQKKGTQND